MHQWNIYVDICNATTLMEGLTPLEPSAVTLDGYHSTVSLRGELGIPFCADVMEFVSGRRDRSDFSFFQMKSLLIESKCSERNWVEIGIASPPKGRRVRWRARTARTVCVGVC